MLVGRIGRKGEGEMVLDVACNRKQYIKQGAERPMMH